MKQTAKKFFKRTITNPASSSRKKPGEDKSPKNKRAIPELNLKGSRNVLIFLVCFICGILLLGILLAEQSLVATYTMLQQVQQQRNAVYQDVLSWQKIMAKYPNYRDGYFHLALLDYELGNTKQAGIYNQQVLTLDPNFAQGRELDKKLQMTNIQ